jgi:hypothetical protein
VLLLLVRLGGIVGHLLLYVPREARVVVRCWLLLVVLLQPLLQLLLLLVLRSSLPLLLYLQMMGLQRRDLLWGKRLPIYVHGLQHWMLLLVLRSLLLLLLVLVVQKEASLLRRQMRSRYLGCAGRSAVVHDRCYRHARRHRAGMAYPWCRGEMAHNRGGMLNAWCKVSVVGCSIAAWPLMTSLADGMHHRCCHMRLDG